jgi:hypothetical protein
MTIVFMSIVAAFIGERISVTLGLYLWPLLILFGFYSVFYWYFSEQQGEGDLRIYLGVQLFTIFVILIMMLTTSPYTRTWDLGLVILFFGLARLCEMYDHQIFMFTQGVVSGHTLKHLAAAIAGLWLIKMAWKRKIVQKEI